MSDDQQEEPVFWEPWRPQVGQRVRIRASSECPTQEISPLPDGATGVVSEIEPGRAGHRYVVLLDVRDAYRGSSPCCAAIELEPAERAGGAA